MMVAPFTSLSSLFTKLLPTNPAAPVTYKVLSFKFILSIICEIRYLCIEEPLNNFSFTITQKVLNINARS